MLSGCPGERQGPRPAEAAAGGFLDVERGISGIFSFWDAPTVLSREVVAHYLLLKQNRTKCAL